MPRSQLAQRKTLQMNWDQIATKSKNKTQNKRRFKKRLNKGWTRLPSEMIVQRGLFNVFKTRQEA